MKKVPFKVFIKHLLSIGLAVYIGILIANGIIYGIRYLFSSINIYNIINYIFDILDTPVGELFIVPGIASVLVMFGMLLVYLIGYKDVEIQEE